MRELRNLEAKEKYLTAAGKVEDAALVNRRRRRRRTPTPSCPQIPYLSISALWGNSNCTKAPNITWHSEFGKTKERIWRFGPSS